MNSFLTTFAVIGSLMGLFVVIFGMILIDSDDRPPHIKLMSYITVLLFVTGFVFISAFLFQLLLKWIVS